MTTRVIGSRLYQFLKEQVIKNLKDTADAQVAVVRKRIDETKIMRELNLANGSDDRRGNRKTRAGMLEYVETMLETAASRIEHDLQIQLSDLKSIEKAVVDLFLFAGTDMKGRVNMLLGSDGTAIALGFEVNPLGVVGLLAKLKIDLTGTKMKTCAPLMIRMPSVYGLDRKGAVERPVNLLLFKGTTMAGQVEAGLEVGIGFEAGWKLAPGAKGTKPEAEAKRINDGEIEADSNYELLSACVEFKASATAGGKLTHRMFYGYSLARFSAKSDDTEGLRHALPHLLAAGSDEALEVERVIELVNKLDHRRDEVVNPLVGTDGHWYEFWPPLFDVGHLNKGYLYSVQPAGRSSMETTFHVVDSAAEAYKVLSSFPHKKVNDVDENKKKNQEERIDKARGQVELRKAMLLPYADPKPNCYHFLFLTNTDGGLGLSLFAGAQAQANALGIARVQGEAGVNAELAGGRIWATSRFQTACPTSQERRKWVGMTVDSKITYTRVVLSHWAGAKAEGYVYKKGDSVDWKLHEGEHRFYDRITYECATLFWVLDEDEEANPWSKVDGEAEQDRWGKDARRREISVEKGTGVAFGGSYLVSTLANLYRPEKGPDGTEPKPGAKVCEARHTKALEEIAECLHLKKEQVVEFFNSEGVRDLLVNSQGKGEKGTPDPWEMLAFDEDGSVLVEATFKVSQQGGGAHYLYESEKDGVKEAVADAKAGTTSSRLIKFPTPRSDLLEDARKNMGALESIRIRYRRCDHVKRTPLRFALGSGTYLGNSLSLTVRDVHEAGNDAIIDLLTCYFDDALGKRTGEDGKDRDGTPDEVFEDAVPGAILFTQ